MIFRLLFLFSIIIASARSGLPAQELNNFPIDPYQVLKTWDYQDITKNLGPGNQIIDTLYGQPYLAGYRYEAEWFRKQGNLEFYFSREGVNRMQFTSNNDPRVISPEQAELIIRDTAFRNTYNREVQLQDSLRHDSLIRDITSILGPPISTGPTPAADKLSRFSSIWFRNGYSCLLKDLISSTLITFTLSRTPDWAVREFDMPSEAQIILKMRVVHRRMAWLASLLAEPGTTAENSYRDIFLILEYDSGQRYAEKLPSFPQEVFLPGFSFSDLNGDAISEAWISVPANPDGTLSRHYIYDLQYREPYLVFDTDFMLPAVLEFRDHYNLEIFFPGGMTHEVLLPQEAPFTSLYLPTGTVREPTILEPAGFSDFRIKGRNRDGSVDYTGTIALIINGQPSAAQLSVTYSFHSGSWEPGSLELTK